MHVHRYDRHANTLLVCFYADLVAEEADSFISKWISDTSRDAVLALDVIVLDFRRIESADLDNTDQARVSLWVRQVCEYLGLSVSEFEAFCQRLLLVNLVDNDSEACGILKERVRRVANLSHTSTRKITDSTEFIEQLIGVEVGSIESELNSLHEQRNETFSRTNTFHLAP